MNQQEATAWKQFSHTGKVEDYLTYCQMKDQTPAREKETVAPDATHIGGSYPSAIQNRNG